MPEKSRPLIYLTGIILLFALLIFIIWLVYDYQIHMLDSTAKKTAGHTISLPTLNNCYEKNRW